MRADLAAFVRDLDVGGVSVGTEGQALREGAKATRVDALSGAFPNGVPASLHILEADRPRDGTAACALALCLASALAPQRTLAFVSQGLVATEAGTPYGPGLRAHGHDPARFLFVEARRPADALWALEECLRSRSVGAVVGELHDRRALDLTATRRLALRAERAEVPALLVSHLPLSEAALAARSRWRVSSAPSGATSADPSLLGQPSFDVSIFKNRDGTCPSLRLAATPAGTLEALPAAAPPRAAPVPQDGAGPSGAGDRAATKLIEPAVLRLSAERRRRDAHARMRS